MGSSTMKFLVVLALFAAAAAEPEAEADPYFYYNTYAGYHHPYTYGYGYPYHHAYAYPTVVKAAEKAAEEPVAEAKEAVKPVVYTLHTTMEDIHMLELMLTITLPLHILM